jgi:DNA-binding winged helix-turn-helix (wHTH) protein/TolB-like protein/Flp pilus assembly protein TadD
LQDLRVYEFEGYRIDADERLLRRDDEVVSLPPKAVDLLLALISNHGRVVSKDDLMASVWADSIVEEANLSHNIFLLRKAFADKGGKFIETVPKRGYRFAAPVLADTAANVVFDSHETVTRIRFEEEIKDSDDPGPGGSRMNSRWKWGVVILSGVVLCAITLWVVKSVSVHTPTVGAANKAVAVLPFKNESGNEEIDYLADGITETLISSLSKLKTVNVKPRASVLGYKGSDVTVSRVGAELNVPFVLYGRITQRGDELTVFLSLIDARSEYQVWGKQYVRSLSDLASFQREMGRDVATSLDAQISGTDEQTLAKSYSENAEAYRHYLLGRYYWNKFTGEGILKAIESFQEAIKLDPDYALAYAGLADSFCVLGVNGHMPRNEAAPKVENAATRAVELDSGLAEAHQAMGAYKLFFQWDLAGADRSFLKAIERDSTLAAAHELYSFSLIGQLRGDEALAEIKTAADLEPTSLIILSGVASTYRFLGRFSEAIDVDRRTLKMDPNFPQIRFGIAFTLSRIGEHEQAIREITKGIELSDNSSRMRAASGVIQARSGNLTAAKQVASELVREASHSYVSPIDIAFVFSAMGEKDKAFEWLEKAVAERSCWLFLLKADPDWEPIRSDPRFENIVQKVGLS